MNCKIPFTKEIDFGKKVSEITSISLEHEKKLEDGMLKGNFIVSGDFKSHEVSVNKEPFSYVLPFELVLAEDIDEATLEFMIDDFTYEIVDNSILKVNIEFSVIAAQKEVKKEEEPLFKDPAELFQEDKKEEPVEERAVSTSIEVEQSQEEKTEKVSEETIINSIQTDKDEYATYHIHMVSDGETVETICTMYNSNMGVLGEYNNLAEVTSGDKLIIPESNE